MTDRKLLELIASQVSNLTTQVDTITTQVNTLTTQVDTITTQVNTLTTQVDTLTKELAEVKVVVIKMENDHGQKLGALFDGYILNSEKLDRIESEVSRHDEFILKRIK